MIIPKLTRDTAKRARLKLLAFPLLLLLTFVCNCSYAQNDTLLKLKPAKLRIGIAGGANINSFTQEQPQTGISIAFNGGIGLQYRLPLNFFLQAEANYLGQGGQLIRFKDDTRFGFPETFTFKNVKNSNYTLHSLELPLLLKKVFKLSQQTWTPAVYAGGSIAFTIKSTERYNKTGMLLAGEYIPATVTGNQDAQMQFADYRYNAIVGASFDLPLSASWSLQLDSRYLLGLTPALRNYSYVELAGFDTDVRSSTFLSRIGVICSFPRN